MRTKLYVAHPFKGRIENMISVQRKIQDWLELEVCTDVTFVSPLHATGFLYHTVSWEEGLEMCFDLMDSCDGVIFCDGWGASKGCNAEMDRCFALDIPYFFENEIAEALTYPYGKKHVVNELETCYNVHEGDDEMVKMEIGDTVKIVTPLYTYDKVGKEGTVKAVSERVIEVKFPDHATVDSYPVGMLEVVTMKPPVEVHKFGDLKVVFNYPHTIVVRKGVTARVTLFREDTYNKWKGFEEAMKKLIKKEGNK